MPTRSNEAAWMESRQRWQIKVQRDGLRKTFISYKEGTKGKVEAERAADKWLASGALKEGLRFGTVWEEFIAEKTRLKRSQSYINQLSWAGRIYLLPALKHKKVENITPQDWQDCILDAYDKGKAHKTLKDIRGAITTFCAYCRKRAIQINQPFDLEIPADAPAGEKKILGNDDIVTLFNKDFIMHNGKEKPCHYIHAWRLIFLTGLRVGELCGIKSKTDIAGNILSLHQVVDQYGNINTHGKSKNAIRRIPLCDDALLAIKAQKNMLKQKGIVSPWLFPNERGQMSLPDRIYRHWLPFRRQNNIACTIHELRHSFISLNKLDLSPELLKMIVGHTKETDTFGIYGHETETDLQRAATVLNSIFAPLVNCDIETSGYKLGTGKGNKQKNISV